MARESREKENGLNGHGDMALFKGFPALNPDARRCFHSYQVPNDCGEPIVNDKEVRRIRMQQTCRLGITPALEKSTVSTLYLRISIS
jgi:hypothetical protein